MSTSLPQLRHSEPAWDRVLQRHSQLPFKLRPAWSENKLIKIRKIEPPKKSNTTLWHMFPTTSKSADLVRLHRNLRLPDLLTSPAFSNLALLRRDARAQVHWRSAK